jgi:hypothetical protein
MSDLMLYGVLRMPYDLTMANELSRRQFYSRVQEAAGRLEAAEGKLAEIESNRVPSSAPTAGGERQSIDTPEFQSKVGNWSGAALSDDEYTRTVGAKEAWGALIAHIETWAGRSTDERERELRAKMGAMQAQIDQLTEDLVVARSAGDAVPACWCHKCNKDRTVNGLPYSMTTMILCAICGNKRCPRATDHALACTGSNEPGQIDSVYGAAPAPGNTERTGG